MRPVLGRILAAGVGILTLAATAAAMIEALYSLEQVLKECSHVMVGRLESVDAKARTAVTVVDRALKGRADYARVRMNIALGPAHHAKYLMDRMQPGQPVLLFYKHEGRSIACLVHSNDTWWQLFADDDPKNRDQVWWRFTHIEEKMGRTFPGPTADLIRVTTDVLAGRAKPPKPDPSVPPLDTRRMARPAIVSSGDGKGGGFHRRTTFACERDDEVRGISAVDVNGDGLLDLLLCRLNANLLLINQGEGFKEMAREFGLAEGSRAAAWADYNADDHPDLMTSHFRLFTNAGGRLRDDSRLLVPAPASRNPEGAGWIDYDGDGRPDLLVTNAEHGIRLYRNTGHYPQAFEDVSDAAGLGAKGLGAGNGDFVCFFDYDGDGYTDFLYNLGRGVLARNEGGRLFRLDTRSGIELPDGAKRGVAVADFDNDGDLDLFVPAEKRPRLYRNNNNGTFTDVLDAAGDLAKTADPCFAAAWGDVNGDGHLDLFVAHTGRRARLYLGDGRGRFTDVAQEAGLGDLAPAYGALLADVDGDGDLDLVVNLPAGIVIACNDLPRPSGFGQVTVRLHARRGTVGPVVRALDERGRLLGLRELSGADGPGGQPAPVAHFGLPLGKVRLSACLSDGRVAQRTVDVGPAHTAVALRDEEFK